MGTLMSEAVFNDTDESPWQMNGKLRHVVMEQFEGGE